jgi:hypothetical protein
MASTVVDASRAKRVVLIKENFILVYVLKENAGIGLFYLWKEEIEGMTRKKKGAFYRKKS